MFVTLAAVIIALVLGHLAPSLAASVRHYGWYDKWLRWLDLRLQGLAGWRSRFGIAVALIPPLIVVFLFQIALHEPMFGAVGVLFGIAVLFYAWGPRDLDVDVDAIAEASDPVSRDTAAQHLWRQPNIAPEAEARTGQTVEVPLLVEWVFRSALHRWFGVLFWFLMLGPVGALLYRLVALSADDNALRMLPAATAQGARKLLLLLDWPVAQLVALSIALVSNFDTVVSAWKDAGGASLQLNTDFLWAAGCASVRSELADEAQDYVEEVTSPSNQVVVHLGELPELRDAMSVVWRVLVGWMAVLALFVIAGWVS